MNRLITAGIVVFATVDVLGLAASLALLALGYPLLPPAEGPLRPAAARSELGPARRNCLPRGR
jgi:hypothetical protein